MLHASLLRTSPARGCAAPACRHAVPQGGLEYVLDLAQPPHLFVIRKQHRKGADAAPGALSPLAFYYVLDKCVGTPASHQCRMVHASVVTHTHACLGARPTWAHGPPPAAPARALLCAPCCMQGRLPGAHVARCAVQPRPALCLGPAPRLCKAAGGAHACGRSCALAQLCGVSFNVGKHLARLQREPWSAARARCACRLTWTP